MSLLKRIEKLEQIIRPKEEKIHFLGWKDCEWRYAEGLTRGESESKKAFFERVKAITDKKWIWCD